MMDQGKLLFVVEIPPNFEADVRAQRKTGIQINVDATAVAQAGNGAGYLNTAIATEIQRFIGGREGSTGVFCDREVARTLARTRNVESDLLGPFVTTAVEVAVPPVSMKVGG
jgi:hypothetical protein